MIIGTLDHAAAWERMRSLIDQLATSLDHDGFGVEVLDALVELLGADRGLVVLGDPGGGGQVVAARRRGTDLSPAQREEVSKSVMEAAARTGRLEVWEPEPSASWQPQSMIDLSIKTAIAAPLRSAQWYAGGTREAVRGVVYLDFRSPLTQVGALHREFIESAANLLASTMEQRRKLERVRASRGETGGRDVSESAGGPDLDELLRPQSMEPIRREVTSALAGDSGILILGESGTGKTRIAQAIAEASGKLPVVRAMLGASDDLNTITSELFGHERGSFSGAVGKRVGLVEMADGGTLILDELLNLPLHAQQLLLDFTQFGTYRPLGWQAREPKRARVRIISATNGDLTRAIREGRFRQDLYFRLSAVPLELPPLRARAEDIPALAEGFLRRVDPERRWRLSVPARRLLLSDQLVWPGNVRQLEGAIRRARERAIAEDPETDTLRPDHIEPRDLDRAALDLPAADGTAAPRPLAADFQIEPGELADTWTRLEREREELVRVEREIVELAMREHGGVVAHVARELGIPRTTLASRLELLGVERERGTWRNSSRRRAPRRR